MQNQTIDKPKNFTRSTIASALAAGALVVGGAGAASAAELVNIDVVSGQNQLERSLEAAQIRADYTRVYGKAEKLDVAPAKPADRGRIAPEALKRKLAELRKQIRKAEREPQFPRPESVGVSSATLASIAACESGGSPTIVSSNGLYHGKYQFDLGTWAGVGGSGDPAAAPEAEQDYRAALLYARSGHSPWPVCG